MNLENKIEAQRKRMEQEKNKLDMLMKKAKIEQRKADNHRKIVVGANFETFLNEPRRYSEEQTRRIMQVAFATRGRCCAVSDGCRMSGGHPFARTEAERRPCRGQSAVEQSAYISRTSLYSDYYGMTYNRTAKEECLLGSDKLKAFDTLQSINFKGISLKKLKNRIYV